MSTHEARVYHPEAISRMVPQDREAAVDVWGLLMSHVELVNFILDRFIVSFAAMAHPCCPPTSSTDGCNLSSLTSPLSKATLADLDTSQWLTRGSTNAGSRMYWNHQSRYPGVKKAPRRSRIRGF